MVRAIVHVDAEPQSHSTLSTSRGRKIRCDGAKPACYHCSQREGNTECTYDPLPKRRGPDRIQGARTRGLKSKDEIGEPPRRRRRHPVTVDHDRPPQVPGASLWP
jgi:hypothetical protein